MPLLETTIRPADATCAEAVRRYADLVARRTGLAVAMVAAPETADVEFDDDGGPGAVRIAFESRSPAGPACADGPADEEAGPDDSVPLLLQPYARTLRSLALHPETARRMLGSDSSGGDAGGGLGRNSTGLQSERR